MAIAKGRRASARAASRAPAIGYVRWSIHDPLDEAMFPEAQEREIARACASLGLRLTRIVTDTGRSGEDGIAMRIGFVELLEAVRRVPGATVVVARLDRLATDVVRQELMRAELLRVGARVTSAVPRERVAAGEETSDEERALVRRVLGEQGAYERALRDARVAYRVGRSPAGSGDREHALLSRIERLTEAGASRREIGEALRGERLRRPPARWSVSCLWRKARREGAR